MPLWTTSWLEKEAGKPVNQAEATESKEKANNRDPFMVPSSNVVSTVAEDDVRLVYDLSDKIQTGGRN